MIKSVFVLCVDGGDKPGLFSDNIYTSKQSAMRELEVMQRVVIQPLCIAEFQLKELSERAINSSCARSSIALLPA